MAKKSKDPSFLFYSQDFLVGTTFMEDHEIGKYIKILCYQHTHGHLSEEMMSTICRGVVPKNVLFKFIQDENGNWYNERLEEVIEERKTFKQLQSENAKSGHEKRKKDNGNDLAPAESLPSGNSLAPAESLPALEDEDLTHSRTPIRTQERSTRTRTKGTNPQALINNSQALNSPELDDLYKELFQ